MLRSGGIPDLARKQAVPRGITGLDRPHANRKSTPDEWIVHTLAFQKLVDRDQLLPRGCGKTELQDAIPIGSPETAYEFSGPVPASVNERDPRAVGFHLKLHLDRFATIFRPAGTPGKL